jgi:hypothetical protein
MGGMQIQRHNDLRDLTAQMLNEVCHNVTVEPVLQALSGESFQSRGATTDEGARLDIVADSFWEGGQRAFFDVRVFNPCAVTYENSSLKSCYSRVERQKQTKFDERIREVEFGTFSPLVFTTSGGQGPIAKVVYKRLANLISVKHHKPYNATINYIRCCLSFSLIRSVNLCLRGTRSKPPVSRWIDLASSFI